LSVPRAAFEWDRILLLIAPKPVILTRLRERSSNTYGKSDEEQEQVLRDLREFEPLLRCTADATIDTTAPLPVVVDRILTAVDPSETHER
jgi:hypothetical protein